MPTKAWTPTSQTVYGRDEGRYLQLVRQFPLRPIRSDADLDAAVEVVDALVDQPKLSGAERDYLDVLTGLIESYEEEAVPIRPVSDAGMLKFLIEGRGASQVEVAKKTGIAESTISEILSGRRTLNRLQIGKIAKYFRVSPGVFA